MAAMDDWRRIGAWSGIVFVVLFIVGGAIQADAPIAGDSGADILAYYADDGDQYIIGDFFFALGFVFFFLPFASCLTAYLASAEGTPAVWSWLVIIAAAILTAVGGGLGAAQGGLAYGAAETSADEAMAELLTDVVYYGFTSVFAFATALMVFCTSILILRKGTFWPWLSWYGLAYVVAALISFFALLSDDPESGLGILGFIVLIAFGVWALIVSYGMMKKDIATG